MATAKKRENGMWRCQVLADGVRRSFTAHTKKEAEYLALEWQTRKKQERNPENLTVETAMERYIESRNAILSPPTIHGYKQMKRLYFTTIKHKQVGKLTDYDVQMEINLLSKTLSPKTIRNAYGFLRSALHRSFDVTLPKKEKIEYKTPNVDEIRFIFQKTQGTDVEIPVLLALWCGLRLSEIRGLKWDKVKKDKLIIDNVIVDVDGVPVEKPPKTTESKREISIPPYIYNSIHKLPKVNEYVIQKSGHAIYNKFRRLTGNICRFHDLRHANASVMLMIGVQDKYAMERGGWSTERIMKTIYQQTYSSEMEVANKKIDDFFLEVIAPENAPDQNKDLLN